MYIGLFYDSVLVLWREKHDGKNFWTFYYFVRIKAVWKESVLFNAKIEKVEVCLCNIYLNGIQLYACHFNVSFYNLVEILWSVIFWRINKYVYYFLHGQVHWPSKNPVWKWKYLFVRMSHISMNDCVINTSSSGIIFIQLCDIMYDGLNNNGPHRLKYLNAYSLGSRRNTLIGLKGLVSVVGLKKVWQKSLPGPVFLPTV